jgi:hypothetical protein
MAYWIYFGFVVALVVVNLIGIAIAGWLQTAFATTGIREVLVESAIDFFFESFFFFFCLNFLFVCLFAAFYMIFVSFGGTRHSQLPALMTAVTNYAARSQLADATPHIRRVRCQPGRPGVDVPSDGASVLRCDPSLPDGAFIW